MAPPELTFVGDLAEFVVDQWLWQEGVIHSRWHKENPVGMHDFDIGRWRVDVKCKRIGAEPDPHPEYFIDRHCFDLPSDYLLLTYYQWRARRLWLVGFAHTKTYWERSQLIRHGERIPTNGYAIRGQDVMWCERLDWIMPPRRWLAEIAEVAA
jgi:hypothetical protein